MLVGTRYAKCLPKGELTFLSYSNLNLRVSDMTYSEEIIRDQDICIYFPLKLFFHFISKANQKKKIKQIKQNRWIEIFCLSILLSKCLQQPRVSQGEANRLELIRDLT